MGDLPESFPKSVRVKTKHAEKTRWFVGSVGNPESSRGCYKMVSEQTSPSTVWFGDEPSGSWWACNTHVVAFDIPLGGYERFPI